MAGSVRAPARRGPIRATLGGVDEGGDPVGDIQRRRFARQQVIAQGAQHHGQVGEQLLGRGVVEARRGGSAPSRSGRRWWRSRGRGRRGSGGVGWGRGGRSSVESGGRGGCGGGFYRPPGGVGKILQPGPCARFRPTRPAMIDPTETRRTARAASPTMRGGPPRRHSPRRTRSPSHQNVGWRLPLLGPKIPMFGAARRRSGRLFL